MINLFKIVFNLKILLKIAFILSFIGLFVLISDFGFNQSESIQKLINSYYFIVLSLGIVATLLRYITQLKTFKQKLLYLMGLV